MSFPFDDDFNQNEDIQINEDTSGGYRNDFYGGGAPVQNNTYNLGMEWGNTNTYDPEEESRMNQRREEEKERKRILTERISKELEDKQRLRNEALEYLQRWENQRSNNITKKKEFNRTNETEYLRQRADEKAGNINPWDKIIQNIQLKEGEHKGIRDVSRMKAVILQRKNDFVQMKMK